MMLHTMLYDTGLCMYDLPLRLRELAGVDMVYFAPCWLAGMRSFLDLLVKVRGRDTPGELVDDAFRTRLSSPGARGMARGPPSKGF